MRAHIWRTAPNKCLLPPPTRASLIAQMVKNLPAVWETWVQCLGQKDSLEKGIATHSSILAWEIPWTEESGGLQSMGLKRVGHDIMTKQQQNESFISVTIFFNFPFGSFLSLYWNFLFDKCNNHIFLYFFKHGVLQLSEHFYSNCFEAFFP